jgi:hypothetical protein
MFTFKNGKKFYNLLCETIFQAFRHAFFIFVASSLLVNSHISLEFATLAIYDVLRKTQTSKVTKAQSRFPKCIDRAEEWATEI